MRRRAPAYGVLRGAVGGVPAAPPEEARLAEAT